MPKQYAHTLIAEDLDFTPTPQQIAAFFEALVKLGAAPDAAKLRVMKLSGEVRSFKNPFTGETKQIPWHTHVPVADIAAIPEAIAGLVHYKVIMSGQGPPELPALTFDHKGMYEFLVLCNLREQPVSTSSCADNVRKARGLPFFDDPCLPTDRTGVFQNAEGDKIIEVPNAGCACFWIQVEYGKWLFPKIENSLEIIEPSIVASARQCFGTKFVQGCHWIW